jgi:Spy/CpxP family protein refolding chaperone
MTHSNDPSQALSNDGRGASRRRFLIGISAFTAIGAAVAGAAVVSANTRSWHHADSPEEMAEHIEDRVDHILKKVDATPEQKEQIAAIVSAAATDVHAMRDQHKQAHQQLKEMLSASTIDRSQLETMRMQHLALADEASKRLATAFADAADVLTPEQRLALADKLEKHRRHGWRHEE